MTEPVSYREPARPRRTTCVGALVRRESSRHAAALGSVAAVAGASALAVGQVELWALAGAGALAAAAHLVRTVQCRRQRDAVERFLGAGEVIVTPGSWTSRDGRRRLRAVLDDALVRWEELDPRTGETLSSFRAHAPIAPSPPPVAEVLAREIAPVHGRARELRCFDGLPRELGGGALRAVDPRWIVVGTRREGVAIERRDARGRSVGDTLHPDRTAALRQLARELGPAMGPLVDASERELVIAREPEPSGWGEPIPSRMTI